MEKTILYPFEPQLGNAATFNLTIKLARRLNAKVILFSVLPPDSTPEATDQVFLHLLGLLGNYRAHHQAWKQHLGVRFERIISQGDVADSLRELMSGRKIDLVVCQPHNRHLNQRGMRKYIPPHLLPELIDPRSRTGLEKGSNPVS